MTAWLRVQHACYVSTSPFLEHFRQGLFLTPILLCCPKKRLHHLFSDLCCTAAMLPGYSLVEGCRGTIAQEACERGHT
jgi:hypothetical protein